MGYFIIAGLSFVAGHWWNQKINDGEDPIDVISDGIDKAKEKIKEVYEDITPSKDDT